MLEGHPTLLAGLHEHSGVIGEGEGVGEVR